MDNETVSELVDALGGTVKVSAILGVTPAQVSNMRAEGRFPPKHYFALREAAAAASVALPEKLFASQERCA